jgi:hypothetical protein
MAYPMTHLYIAKKIIDEGLCSINNKSQYYLGALVPDAVEFRQKYDKSISHLYKGNEKWGFITSYEKWTKDILGFYKENLKTNDMDFLIGYCIHILTDINYSKDLWTPYRLENININFDDVNKESHHEGYIVDFELYQKCNCKEEIWKTLNESKSIDFMDLVYKGDMEKMKNNVLNVQYKKQMVENSENNKIVSYNRLLEYIESTRECIIEKFIKKI